MSAVCGQLEQNMIDDDIRVMQRALECVPHKPAGHLDAAWIAAASPDRIGRLLDEIKKLRGALVELDALLDTLSDE